ncbi:hypothetical protein [Oceanobacillus sp. FSL W7-1281]|uniref:hypothetical protein n=1 Tax=Oceanobacillus sp. FSL W7-1281 TaxID=2921698 RepID=UPI0030D7A98F
MDKAARPDVEGMKNADVNKTELRPKRILVFLLDLFNMKRVQRSANPDTLTALPMINEPTISHTTSSEREWYNNSDSPAPIKIMNIMSAMATKPALQAVISEIAVYRL